MAQNNLEISKVIYIAMSSNTSIDFIAKDTTLIIPNGKVWEITNTKVFMTFDNRMLGDKTSLYINEQIISYSNEHIVQNSDPIWLPAGTY